MDIKPIKTTLIGGIAFLVPVVAVTFALGKALSGTRKLLSPLLSKLPIDSIAGFVILEFLSIVLLLIVCYCAGLLARMAIGKSISEGVEARIHAIYPRYTILKWMSRSLHGGSADENFKPVIIHFDDQDQIAIEIERCETGKVSVYFPGVPDPWSGSIAFVDAERVDRLNESVVTIFSSLKQMGVGSIALLDRLEGQRTRSDVSH